MIQEKDFLYRVPVKTAPITTPGGQIRNPEILVDIEGGEFMHGNILDANSTNKLVNQSVKDAVDKNIADGIFVTKDLLDKEVDRATSAESDLQAAIDTKADAIALSNYVLTTALNQQVDTLNTAINAKQDAGNYIPYDSTNTSIYKIDKGIQMMTGGQIKVGSITGFSLLTSDGQLFCYEGSNKTAYTANGIISPRNQHCIPTTDGEFIEMAFFASRDALQSGLAAKQNKITVNSIDITDIETADVTKLRTIVNNLITALISSGLINTTSGVE